MRTLLTLIFVINLIVIGWGQKLDYSGTVLSCNGITITTDFEGDYGLYKGTITHRATLGNKRWGETNTNTLGYSIFVTYTGNNKASVTISEIETPAIKDNYIYDGNEGVIIYEFMGMYEITKRVNGTSILEIVKASIALHGITEQAGYGSSFYTCAANINEGAYCNEILQCMRDTGFSVRKPR